MVGYSDATHDPAWFHDNPFVRDATALKAQLAALKAEGGGDEPESPARAAAEARAGLLRFR